MNEIIEKTNIITSMEVAEMIGKDHSKLLRDIRNYAAQLSEAKIGLGDFFTENTYLDANNQSRPCFDVTKKGCEFIANKLTGAKGAVFTARYINRFHDMEDAIENPLSVISKELQAVIVVDKRVTQVEKKVDIVRQELERLEFDLPILPIEADRITEAVRKRGVDILGGKGSNAYQDRSMRQRVYSNIYADLKANFRVRSYKSIKRNQCDSALNVIARYDAPLYLQDEIYMINGQHSIWDD